MPPFFNHFFTILATCHQLSTTYICLATIAARSPLVCHEVKTFAPMFTIPAITSLVEDTRNEVYPAFRSLQKPAYRRQAIYVTEGSVHAEVQLHLRLSGWLLTRIPSYNYEATFPLRGLTLWTISSVPYNRTFYNCCCWRLCPWYDLIFPLCVTFPTER